MINHNGINKLKVLVVEDAPIAAHMAKILLEANNCWVDCVESGEEALSKIDSSYDFILLDFGLPGIDGLETAKRIRNGEDSISQIPIIVVTAHQDDEEKIILAKSCGIDDIYSKPLTTDKCEVFLKKMRILNKISN